MHLKTTLYHILVILETFCTAERKTETQATNFLVKPDKMVYPIDVQPNRFPLNIAFREKYRLVDIALSFNKINHEYFRSVGFHYPQS